MLLHLPQFAVFPAADNIQGHEVFARVAREADHSNRIRDRRVFEEDLCRFGSEKQAGKVGRNLQESEGGEGGGGRQGKLWRQR